MGVDTDVDTGILGDLLAFLAGGLVGLVLGLLLGGPFALASFFAVTGVVVLEVVEYVVEGRVRKELLARLEGKPMTSRLACSNADVVVVATERPDEEEFSLGFLDVIPRSILLNTDESDALNEKHQLVTANFDELQMDGSGLAVAGRATPTDLFQPFEAALIGRVRDPDVGNTPGALRRLVYRARGSQVEIDVADALERAAGGELSPPLHLSELAGDPELRLPTGRLAVVCLHPNRIRRQDTVITDILFSSGVDLRVSEAVVLQDAGVLILPGFQLIHPKDDNPYFRAKPDSSEENNLENLPEF